MLSSIIYLPVTRVSVAESKLGRAVVAITGTKVLKDLNASDERVAIIKSHVSKVKKEWSAAVRRERENSLVSSQEEAKDNTNTITTKRQRDTQQTTNSLANDSQQSISKKKKNGSISDLIRKSAPTISAAEAARLKAKERLAKTQAMLNPTKEETSNSKKKVAWPDQNNKETSIENILEVETEFEAPIRSRGSMKDRRKQDVVEEKERLEESK